MANGYHLLRQRPAFPKIDELPKYLKAACQKMFRHAVGTFEVDLDYSKLRTSLNHLNDHIIHFRWRLPNNVKDVAFTMGITDYDKDAGQRVPNKVHAYVQAQMDRHTTAIKVAEAALDDWEKSVQVSVHAQAQEQIPPRPTRPCPVPQEADSHEWEPETPVCCTHCGLACGVIHHCYRCESALCSRCEFHEACECAQLA